MIDEDRFPPEKVSEYLEVRMITLKGCTFPALIHTPTETMIKSWAAIEGLEEGAWYATLDYAENVAGFEAVRWHTDDPDFLYPCSNFVPKYLDPVGNGEMSIDEASAKVMEKIMREAV